MKTLSKNPLLAYLLAFFIYAMALSFSNLVLADEEFYGTIESRPTENSGIWVISGKQVEVTNSSKIDRDNGPLVVGSCVKVEHKKDKVKEIESSKPSKCD
jgi:hypothetical protein